MSDKKSENKNCIHCLAQNCAYNDGECHCTADHIKVGASTACNCGETFCGTFIMETDIHPPKHTF